MVALKENCQETTQEILQKHLEDRYWRLNNLYHILDEQGNDVLYKMNAVQHALYLALWWLNIIPKSRQHGITTFIAIFMLDACLFNDNMRAGIIAHKLADAKKIFRDKIKYAYAHLPGDLKDLITLLKDDAQELLFSNNSSIYVGTSMRSGTLQMLHVSEYGWVCTHAPKKAEEIKSGAIETVHEGGMIFIESTFEGPIGDFADMCELAETLQLSGKELGKMDYKLHFFPWHEKPSNVTDPKFVDVPHKTHNYLDKIGKIFSKTINPEQRAWYVAKKKTLKHLMYKQHPSILEEARIAAVEGAYYAQEIAQMREDGRICHVPHNKKYPVHTVCDLGTKANMPWGFFQVIGKEVHIIDYFCLDKKDDIRGGGAFYKSMLDKQREQYGYNYGKHFGPFDMVKGEIGSGKTICETFAEHGIVFTKLDREISVLNGIERVSNMFDSFYIDVESCKNLINALSSYHREWLESGGMFAEKPVHDSSSHPADMIRYLSMVIDEKLYEMVKTGGLTDEQIQKLNDKYRRTG